MFCKQGSNPWPSNAQEGLHHLATWYFLKIHRSLVFNVYMVIIHWYDVYNKQQSSLRLS
jgi:hypothetical protein